MRARKRRETMSWSKVAFGAAKCAKGVAEHEAAFTRALTGGITGGRHSKVAGTEAACDMLLKPTALFVARPANVRVCTAALHSKWQ